MPIVFFKSKVLPLQNKLYRLAVSMTGNRQEAEDVVQEILIKIWNKRDQWHLIQNMEAWSMRLTRNLSIDKLRSKHRRTDDIEEAYSLSDNNRLEKQIEAKFTLEKVSNWMKLLPEKQKIVLHLRDIEGLSYKEIAEQTGIDDNQVKTYLFRARKNLRNKLKALYENE